MDPHTLILPVKIASDAGGYTPNSGKIASAITYARQNGADVINCSWGYSDLTYQPSVITAALDSAFIHGRGGLGCAIVFAAGNGGENDTILKYPGRLEQCFAVGAIDLNDTVWNFSSHGPSLDIVAPSGDLQNQGDMWTIDQMGNKGNNPLHNCFGCPPVTWDCGLTSGLNDINYHCHFGATSAAAPLVAGTAALILARDSSLTATEVYDLLRKSAVTDLASGVVDTPDGHYGYGRVDAFRAILSIARGDANNDVIIDIIDLTSIIDFLFINFAPPFPDPLLADVDCSGLVDIGDINRLIDYLFETFTPLDVLCYNFGP